MTELLSTLRNQRSFHSRLFATASTLSLLTAAFWSASAASGADSDGRPTIWIELGGQLERADGGQQQFAPMFVGAIEQAGLSSPLSIQRPPHYSNGFEGRLSFIPEGSAWEISAAIRYGRSNSAKHLHQSTGRTPIPQDIPTLPSITTLTPRNPRFVEATSKQNETHAVVDFQVGKDVGLGIFGAGGSSVISLGVRIAQMNSKADVAMNAQVDHAYPNNIFKYPKHHHSYAASIHREFNSWVAGPSLSWDASIPFGGGDTATFALNWGANAAVLFGRQKSTESHQTRTAYYSGMKYFEYPISSTQHAANHSRSHSVVVPNVGGFAGLSVNFHNAKVALGYRADLFFGAMDGGIDVRKTYNRNFYGPFATISVGLGG